MVLPLMSLAVSLPTAYGQAPTITAEPQSQMVLAGANVSLSVTASGTEPLSYQWHKDGVALADGGRIAGALTPGLSVNNVVPSDEGGYRVVVTNAQGSVTSQVATLTLLLPPVIVRQPFGRAVVAGSNVAFNVLLSGTPPFSCQWQFQGQNISDATNATLVVTNAQADAVGQYAVVVSNSVGSVTSMAAGLTVVAPDAVVVAWGMDNEGQCSRAPPLSHVVAVGGGAYFSLALKSDGTIVGWWSTNYGTTVPPADLSNVITMAVGDGHALALRSDATVVSWGWNQYGQTNVPAGLSNVVAIAAGATHSLALKSDGTVIGWGSTTNGETTTPLGLSNVVGIAAGSAYWGSYSLALKDDGTLAGWGYDGNGVHSPPAGLAEVASISSGRGCLAIKRDGTVVAWGDNSFGQTNVPSGLSNVLAVATGSDFRLALKRDGTVAGWGRSWVGQIDIPAGLAGVVSIAAGGHHSLALMSGPPTIQKQPASLMVSAGGAAGFEVWCAGPGPLQFQWYHNGTNCPGQTNANLTFASAQPVNGGEYFAVVSNAHGAITSQVATLSFNTGLPGSIDLSFLNGSGVSYWATVSSVALQADGKVLIAGSFMQVNGVPRHGLARLNPDASLDTSFNPLLPANETVSCVVLQPDGRILIGGGFTNLNGVPCHRVARLMPDGSLDASFDPGSGADGDVSCLAVQADGRIILGGVFTNFNGVARQHLARLNPDGSLDTTFSPVLETNLVWTAVPQTDGKVLVGGSFTTLSGRVRQGIARLNADGSLDTSFDPASAGGGSVSAIAVQPDGKILIGGDLAINGFGRRFLARLNADGSLDNGFNLSPGPDGYVCAIVRQPDGKLLIGGSFATVHDTPRRAIARLTEDGSLDAAFDPGSGINMTVSSLSVQPDGQLLIGGTFTYVNGYYRNSIARLNNTLGATITTQPSDQVAAPGLDASFAVAVVGTAPISYQWLWNGAAIPDATNSSFSIQNSSFTNAGTYSVIVSNAYGVSLSSSATLSIVNVAAWGWNEDGQTDVPFNLTNAVAVAAGRLHSLALRDDGTLVAWGDNTYGQLNILGDLSNVVAIAGGRLYSLALRNDGTVAAWGNGDQEQTNVPAGLSNVVALAPGQVSALALKSDGTLAVWGLNDYGQTNIPPGLDRVVGIAAGYFHFLALRADGTVAAWGRNVAHEADVPSGLSNVVAIASGAYHSLALKADGTVVQWGDFDRSAPVPPDLSNAVALAGGGWHNLALKADRTVAAWGWYHGVDVPFELPSGLSDVAAIAAGENHDLAIVGQGPPHIMAPRIAPTAYAGGFLCLPVTVIGRAPMSCQWFLNATNAIPGATNAALTLSSVWPQHAGSYSLVVSNSFGSVTNQVASLGVSWPSNVSLDFTWAAQLGPGDDQTANGLTVDGEGNVYVTGTYHGALSAGTNSLSSLGNDNLFFVKYDAGGNAMLARGASGGSAGTDIAVDAEGNVFVTGSFSSSCLVGTNSLSSTGASEFLLVKFDRDGNALWARQSQNSGWISGDALAVDATGNAYVVGNIHWTPAASFETTVLIPTHDYNAFLAKYAPDGELHWVQPIAGGNLSAAGVALDNAGRVYVTGSGSGGVFGTNILEGSFVFLAQYDASGNVLWARAADYSSHGGSAGVAVSPAGEAVLAGAFDDSLSFGTNALTSAGGYDVFVAKYDTAGNLLWAAQAGGAGNETSADVAVDPTGLVYVAGTFDAAASFDSHPFASRGSNDLFVAQLDAQGSVRWAIQAGGSGDDAATALALDALGRPHLAGRFTSPWAVFGGQALTNLGATDGLVGRLGFAAPGIAVQPLSQAVMIGGSVTLSVTAGGSTPLSFQWLLEGAPLGAPDSSELVLTNVQFTHAGSYSVVVRNSYGAVTSLVANLCVAQPLSLGQQGRGQVVKTPDLATYDVGQPVTLTATPGRWYRFLRWSDGVTNNPRSITIGLTNRYTAVFTNTVPLELHVLKEWERDFGGTGYDEINAMQVTSDGGCLVGGSSMSGISGNKTVSNWSNPGGTNNGTADVWLIRLDARGQKLWEREHGGSDHDVANAITAMNDGGWLVTGFSYYGLDGDKTEAGFGSRDLWVIRLDAQGNRLWDRLYGGSGEDYGTRAIQTGDGGFLVAGVSCSPPSGNKTSALLGHCDVWVLKLDANGQKVWERTFGGIGFDSASAVHETADGYAIFGFVSTSVFETWAGKVDREGNNPSQFFYGGNHLVCEVLPMADDGFVIGGFNYGGDQNWRVLRVAAGGSVLSDHYYGGNGNDAMYTLTTLREGGFLGGGLSWSGLERDKTAPNYGEGDCWLIKFDDQAQKVWDITQGGSGLEEIRAVRQTSEGGFLLAGVSKSGISGTKSTPNFGEADYWIVLLSNLELPVGTPLLFGDGLLLNAVTNLTLTETNAAVITVQTSFTNGLIYYTLDGSEPTTNSTRYVGPFLVANTGTFSNLTTLRAVAWSADFAQSASSDPVQIAIIPRPIFLATQGRGTITKSPDQTSYASNQLVTLTATPGRWYRFLRWSDGVTNNPRTITVGLTNTYVAVFTNTVPLEQWLFEEWQRSYGGSAEDSVESVQQTLDGGFILAGPTRSGADGTKASPNWGSWDYWLVRLDGKGSKIWDRSFGGSGAEYSPRVLALPDGGFLLAGSSASSPSGTKTATNYGDEDFWVARVDAGGSLLWDRSFGGTGFDRLTAIDLTFDGGFILGGLSASSPSGTKTSPNWGSNDFWIVRLDQAGNQLWDRSFGGSDNDVLWSLSQTFDGGFSLGGESASGEDGNKTCSSFGGVDFWLVRLDSLGNKVWDRSYGGTGDEALACVRQTSSGGFILGGGSSSGVGGAKTSSNYGEQDFWIVLVDDGGIALWDRTYGGAGSDGVLSLIQTTDGGFLLGGLSRSAAGGTKTSPAYGADDLWVVRLDASGNQLWERSAGGDQPDYVQSLQQTRDGGFVLGGLSLSGLTPTKTCPNYGLWDMWVLKLVEHEVPVGMPVVLVNGQYSPSNHFEIAATNTNTLAITIKSTWPGAELYYTLDGSDPTFAIPYAGSITGVADTLTVRAFAFDGNSGDYAYADPVEIVVVPVYALTVSTPGGGAVSVDPPATTHWSNSVVTLTATPSNGWVFLRWTGDLASTSAVAQLTMDGPKSVQAIFGTTLTVTNIPAGFGATLRQPDQAWYAFGETVRLTAYPTNAGKYFTAWGSAASNNYVNPLLFTVTNATQTVRATFGTLPGNSFALNLFINGSGTVTKTPQQSNHVNGSTVTLTATPDTDWTFAGWSGSVTSSVNPLSVVMNTNKTITADFTLGAVNAPPLVALTSPTNGSTFVESTDILLIAEASDHDGSVLQVQFVADANQIAVVTNSPFSFTWSSVAAGNYALTAVATDNLGTTATSSPVNITVMAPVFPPSITAQPQGQTVRLGGDVSFSVAATGTAPLSYQWLLNGAAIPAATTATLALTNVQFSQAGSYSVTVSNSAGAVTSSNAALVVLPPTQVREEFWVPDGPVLALAEGHGRIYLGGSFSNVYPMTGNAALLDAASGVPDSQFPRVAGEVYAAIPDGADGWFLGGNFTSVGGLPRLRLARVRADKTVDPVWNPGANAQVYALAVANGALYVGGQFTTIGGQTRPNLAALAGATGVVTAWSPGLNGEVDALVVSGTTLYVGGLFSKVGAVNRANAAAFDTASGTLLSWNPGPNQRVRALAASGVTVYLGGDFLAVNGQTRRYVAAVDTGPGTVSPWNPDANQTVRALATAGDMVFAGGDFTFIGGQQRLSLAALDATVNTNNASAWLADADGSVRALTVGGARLFVGGWFTTINLLSRSRLAALDVTTGTNLTWDPGADSPVNVLAASGDVVLAGGKFSVVGVQPRHNLAALDLTSGGLTAWNPGADAPVRALTASSNAVYVGGDFSVVGGQPRWSLAAVDGESGLVLSNWTADADDFVYALAPSGQTLYAGGYFHGVAGVERHNVTALASDTGIVLTNWSTGTPGSQAAFCLAASEATVYVGGLFNWLGGQSRRNLAALDAATGNATAWNPDPDNMVFALAVSGNTVYAGGSFTAVGSRARRWLAALDATLTPNNALDWNPSPSRAGGGGVYALALAGTTVYAGGLFDSIGGQARTNLAALDATNGRALELNPAPDDAVEALLASGNTLFAGGGFTNFGGQRRPCFASIGPVGPPILITQPLDQVASLGANVTFSVTATGQDPLSYQWLFNGTNLAGATSPSLALSGVESGQEGGYSVQVSNRFGAITSAVATLRLSAPPALTVTNVTLFAAPGTNLTLVATNITGSPPFQYQWRLNGVNIPGATQATLTITNAQPTNSGSYSFVVANDQGVASSGIFSVIIDPGTLPFADNFAHRFLTNSLSGLGRGWNTNATRESREPNHAGKPGGHSVWLSWRAPAKGVATFSTRGSGFDTLLAVYVGTGITNLVAVAADEDSGGFLTSTTVFNALEDQEYQIAIDGFGGAMGHLMLSWSLEDTNAELPRILATPASQVVGPGETAAFAVVATNSSGVPIIYQWFFEGAALANETNSLLTVPNVQREQVGRYAVQVTSQTRSVLSPSATLEIGPTTVLTQDKFEDLFGTNTPPTGFRMQKALTQAPGSVPVYAGPLDTQIFQTSGSTLELNEQNHCNLIGGASRWFSLLPLTNGTLVVDTAGSPTNTILAIYTAPDPPDLLTLHNEGCDADLDRDGVSAVQVEVQANLNYYVVVDTPSGSNANIRLNWRLGSRPFITQQPAGQVVGQGETVVFRSAATGTPAPGYQWLRDGQPIWGAISSNLVLANVQPAQAGLYRVVASNPVGAVSSVSALLQVRPSLTTVQPRIVDGHLQVELTGLANQGQATLQVSADLVHWEDVHTANLSGGPLVLSDPTPATLTGRFYRVRLDL